MDKLIQFWKEKKVSEQDVELFIKMFKAGVFDKENKVVKAIMHFNKPYQDEVEKVENLRKDIRNTWGFKYEIPKPKELFKK